MAQTRSLAKLQSRIQTLQASNKRAREKVGETMENVLHAAESTGTAYALGYLRGKADNPNKFELVSGVPTDLSVAAGAHLMALMGVGKGMESHLAAIGNGALASYAVVQGMRHGRKAQGGGSLTLEGDMGISPDDLDMLQA